MFIYFSVPERIGDSTINDDLPVFSELAFLIGVTVLVFYISIWLGLIMVVACGFAASRTSS